MSEDLRPKALHELKKRNRLIRENAENAIVSSMFEASFKASDPIETFTTWLLVGAATVASFIITNAERLLPILGRRGFIVCGGLLCLSCLFGFLSKLFALLCRVNAETSAAVQKALAERLKEYDDQEGEVAKDAEILGANINTRIRMNRIMGEFFRPLPKWAAWVTMRKLKKSKGDPQVAYISRIKMLQAQGLHAFLQALLFLVFMVAGFIFAATS